MGSVLLLAGNVPNTTCTAAKTISLQHVTLVCPKWNFWPILSSRKPCRSEQSPKSDQTSGKMSANWGGVAITCAARGTDEVHAAAGAVVQGGLVERRLDGAGEEGEQRHPAVLPHFPHRPPFLFYLFMSNNVVWSQSHGMRGLK